MQVVELLRENSFRAGGHDGVIVQNNPIRFIDPYGLAFSDILPGIKTALVKGSQAGVYAVGQAGHAIADIATNGPPVAKASLGFAGVTVAAPLAGAATISALPAATSAIYNIAPYSGAIGDFTYGLFVETGPPQGWGYLSSGALTLYDLIRETESDQDPSPCGK